MYIQQLYTNCLAESAYYIESDGEAAVIDPLRDIDAYLALAEKRGAKIKFVFETHFHADFVSGHIDLAQQSGASIIFGPGAKTGYPIYNAKDEEVFQIGKIKIKALHTPGHTPESTSYLLFDAEEKPHAIFTGDTLFVGDVGRPDLLDGMMTKESLAGMLYDSLQNKIKTLPDEVIVYPAHGAGSACGKNIGKDAWSTIGEQKKNNYALQNRSKEEFISLITQGLTAPPAYFFEDARINKEGYTSRELVMQNSMNALSIIDFEGYIQKHALILDTRQADEFENGFIKNSLNIGLEGTFAIWLGTLVNINTPIILITEEGKEKESISRMLRIGFENIKGYLEGGIQTWLASERKIEKINSIDADTFEEEIKSKKYTLLDVRNKTEYENGHVKGALHFPLSSLQTNYSALQTDTEYMIYCGGGYRSMIASSILKSKGYHQITNIYGGWAKIKNTGVEKVVFEIV